MKKLFSFALLGLLLGLAACNKADEVPAASSAAVRVSFRNFVGTEPVATGNLGGGSLRFTNANGDAYSVDMLKYYVSHVALIREDKSEVVSPLHKLIDASDTSTMSVSLDGVPNGRYTSLRFYLGVDSAHNHSGDQMEDLDPIHGMIWSWNTGYIFFKHEGNFKNTAAETKPLIFHLGTDPALPTVTIPLSNFEVKGVARQLDLKFDLNKLYGSPTRVDFNADNNRMSTSRDDALWITVMRENMKTAFTLESAH